MPKTKSKSKRRGVAPLLPGLRKLDPAGRLQAIEEYLDAGFITKRQAKQLLDLPDSWLPTVDEPKTTNFYGVKRTADPARLAGVGIDPNPQPQEPCIELLLWCPGCGKRHLDVGEWATKPHHTHACQHCGMVWRPAVQNTVGVQFLPGFKNEEGT